MKFLNFAVVVSLLVMLVAPVSSFAAGELLGSVHYLDEDMKEAPLPQLGLQVDHMLPLDVKAVGYLGGGHVPSSKGLDPADGGWFGELRLALEYSVTKELKASVGGGLVTDTQVWRNLDDHLNLKVSYLLW